MDDKRKRTIFKRIKENYTSLRLAYILFCHKNLISGKKNIGMQKAGIIKFSKDIIKLLGEKIILIIGIISILYFIAITSFVGYLNIYNCIWVFIGSLLIVIHKIRATISKVYQKAPKIVKLFFVIIAAAFLFSFLIIEGFIIEDARNKNIENAHYFIILGAGLKGARPSLTLLQRINTGIEYLVENKDAEVVASGGKGPHETVTEAEVISKLLQDNGVEKSRIIVEDRSTNTYENLAYSEKLIDSRKKIVIVSSGFHLFRAKSIAKKIGYKNV